jgi:uncharacterized membrane protein
MDLVSALLIGIVAGSRAMMAPAAVSLAARTGWLALQGTGLAFLGHPVTSVLLTVLALGELVTDQLPSTPSRTVPVQFGARLVSGGLAGAAVGMTAGSAPSGIVAGLIGAVIGTFGGRAARGALARAFGSDRPAALLEDAAAIALACVAMNLAR